MSDSDRWDGCDDVAVVNYACRLAGRLPIAVAARRYLVNNKGVTKFTTTPEELDEAETATVTVDLRRLRATGLRELRPVRPLALDGDKNSFTLQVGPGDIRIVKITTGDGSRSE